MLTYQRCSAAFNWEQFHKWPWTYHVFRDYTFKIINKSTRGQWVNISEKKILIVVYDELQCIEMRIQCDERKNAAVCDGIKHAAASSTSRLKNVLTHWGWVMHICVINVTIIGSDNGLSPGRRQAIIWTNAGILLIWSLGTNFGEIICKIHRFSFNKMHLKMSAKWRSFCLGLNDFMYIYMEEKPVLICT